MKAEYLNHYLSDRDVANFARQSFANTADNFTDEQNNNLIKFLARGMQSGDWSQLLLELHDPFNKLTRERTKELAIHLRKIPEHWVPFGHPSITLRMTAPIPIKVQVFKHKIGFVESEESRRYISTSPELFIPDVFRSKADNAKQGSGGAHDNGTYWKYRYMKQCEDAIELYETMIKEGVCPEQARFVLPQGVEANWVLTGSLYAWAHAFNLRTDSHAQKEIQELFHQVGQIIEPLYPVSWGALTRGEY
jgi:thymidylate synthase (FAD)